MEEYYPLTLDEKCDFIMIINESGSVGTIDEVQYILDKVHKEYPNKSRKQIVSELKEIYSI